MTERERKKDPESNENSTAPLNERAECIWRALASDFYYPEAARDSETHATTCIVSFIVQFNQEGHASAAA